ncbi:unnamed protein product [Kuraishia capsulata CBS 1993]|uniref:Glucan 1,3-beta-glucosidase n=1 Tax=Kuraishia capsulata CBS 1993 TaxID=1382522 RepID=W6MMP3_9ASCO|nr:uncharacterized protein KUCA_T00003853001 [Kuraishia capsulata CBS 1993]CDK27874.1 unnamed protein product [Kuraishia capsulata CBS 1993]
MLQTLPLLSILASLVLLATALPVKPSLQLIKRNSRWDYSSDKIYGVNIGGWFVLEPYITPSLFEAFGDNPPVDEYHYTQQLGKDEALNRLDAHWSTWITEKDFEDIAGYGLNFARIPIGYWAFQLLDSDPYVQGQEAYLDQALGWARNNNIKVWIDLHGAPGSQNGFDNSGLRDQIEFQQGDNVQVTLDVLTYISNKYGGSDYADVVIGIQLLNEPLGSSLDISDLQSFYWSGYEAVRNAGDAPVIIHDAFLQTGAWNDVLSVDQGAWDVVVDHHHYQVFSTGELQRSIADHVSVACSWGTDGNSEYHWNLCGEFTAALTDCAYWLNGIGRGARYDGSYESSWIGSCDGLNDYSQWDSNRISETRQYIEAQLDAFEYGKNAGWVFWCLKTESTVEWDFKRLVLLGAIPQPLSDRWFPGQCGF